MLRYEGNSSISEKEFNFFHKFKAAHEGEKDLLVKKAYLSVDSRAITIIPETIKSFNAVQGTYSQKFNHKCVKISHD